MFEPARRVAFVLACLAVDDLDDRHARPGPGRRCRRWTKRTPRPPQTTARIFGCPRPSRATPPSCIDAGTGEVLYEKRADSPRYPASITKIMTLYLAFEALATGRLKETDLITVSPHAAAQAPTKLGLRPGDTITVEDAMHAIAVKSANDMAVALAEKLGGTESRFAALMTMKAQELGMTRTRFVNANGLPDSRQITTARDIATLSRAVLRDYPQYYGYFSQEQFVFRGQAMNNHNGLLGKMPGVDGLKTGFTNAAGFNLAASAVRDGHRLITVVLGGSSGASRNANVEDLLLTGFDIEQRRDHGETIPLTQNLFEAAAGGRAGPRPRYAQGDASDPDRHGAHRRRPRHAGDHRAGLRHPAVVRARPAMVADLGAPRRLRRRRLRPRRRPRPPNRATGPSRSANSAPAASPPARSTSSPTPSRPCSTTARARWTTPAATTAPSSPASPPTRPRTPAPPSRPRTCPARTVAPR